MFVVVPVVELGEGEGGGGVHCDVEDALHFWRLKMNWVSELREKNLVNGIVVREKLRLSVSYMWKRGPVVYIGFFVGGDDGAPRRMRAMGGVTEMIIINYYQS